MAESRLIDEYRHAQGHAFAAEDAAHAALASFDVGENSAGRQHLASAIASLSAALAGSINARIVSLGGDFDGSD